jgi:hypothetical protein
MNATDACWRLAAPLSSSVNQQTYDKALPS